MSRAPLSLGLPRRALRAFRLRDGLIRAFLLRARRFRARQLWARLLWACLILGLAAAPAGAAPRDAGPFLEPGPLWTDPYPPIPVPTGLSAPLGATAAEILAAFNRVPYRADGVVSDDGRHSLWSAPERSFRNPGLNCSGYLLSVSRFLLGANITLAEARRDIRGDSGPQSPWGEDWDFGLDVILNLAGGGNRPFPQDGEYPLSRNARGRPVGWGVNIHAPEFTEILGALAPGRIYFFAISKPDRRFPGGLSYYHNGLIRVGEGGETFLHHATLKAGAHFLDLRNPSSLATFRKAFPPLANGGERRVAFVMAPYPRDLKAPLAPPEAPPSPARRAPARPLAF